MSARVGRLGALALAVFKDAMRRRIAYVVLLFAAVMAAAIPQLPSYGEAVEAAIYREVLLALAFVAAGIVALALSANRVPGEFEKRSMYAILARGVSRAEYLVGTFLGLAAVMAAVVAAFTLLGQVLGFVYYDEPMWRLWEGAIGIWMEVSVLSAITMVFTTRTGPVTALMGALAFLFVAHARGSILSEGTLAWRLYPSLDAFNVIEPVAHGQGVPLAYMGVMVVAFVAWTGVLLAVAVGLFAGRDL